MDKSLLSFLQSQKLLNIATVDEEGNPWLANVYYSITPSGKIFFVSDPRSNHGKHVAIHSQIAFGVTWIDEKDLWNRKAVQGKGTAELLTNLLELGTFLRNHYEYFPTWKEFLTEKGLAQHLLEVRPYIITPFYMKFWNDELYGEDGTKEFTF